MEATATNQDGLLGEFNPRDVKHCPGCGIPLIASPVVKSDGRDDEHRLRSFYYKRGDGYAAECVDLSLMSLGSTPEDAIGKLQEAMFGYLEVAFDGDPTGLVTRPSPLSRRLHYYCHVTLQRIVHLFEANHMEIASSPQSFVACGNSR